MLVDAAMWHLFFIVMPGKTILEETKAGSQQTIGFADLNVMHVTSVYSSNILSCSVFSSYMYSHCLLATCCLSFSILQFLPNLINLHCFKNGTEGSLIVVFNTEKQSS